MEREHEPFFIVGCERSGTTMLRAMLDMHPEIAVPYEAVQFSWLLKVKEPWGATWSGEETVKDLIEEILSNERISFWGLSPNEVRAKLNDVSKVNFAQLLRALYEAYAQKKGKSIWGDKTPRNTYEMSNLIKYFRDARFIHIVRDGRDVALSWAGVRWADYDLEKAAHVWKGWVWNAYRYGVVLGRKRYCEIRYEDLILNTEDVLKSICGFLNLEYSPSMMMYYKKDGLVPNNEESGHILLNRTPDKERLLAWRRSLSSDQDLAFQRIAGDVLDRYRYPRNGCGCLLSPKIWWKKIYGLRFKRLSL